MGIGNIENCYIANYPLLITHYQLPITITPRCNAQKHSCLDSTIHCYIMLFRQQLIFPSEATVMQPWLNLGLGIAIGLMSACTSSSPALKPQVQLQPVVLETSKIVAGQTVYVPVYSHIYTVNQSRRMDLTATLSIRNTDLTHPIILTAVKYYGSDGKLIRTDLENPVSLPSLASTDFVVDQSDTDGGVGANFIVEWVAEVEVSAPVIEAVMIDTISNQGISFISPGRVIQQRNPENN